jgi:hypothetical protein
VQGNEVKLKLNGPHQILAYANDVNVLGDNVNTVTKMTETLIDNDKEVGIGISAEKAKYMLLSRSQNAGQNRAKIEQTDRLKMCHCYNIWEQRSHIKI